MPDPSLSSVRQATGIWYLTPSAESKRIKRAGILVAFIILVVAVVATIALPRNASHAAPTKYRATKAIVFDKATKTVRIPTPAETDAMVAQISSLTNRSTEGLTVQQAANGMKKMDLQGRFNGVVLGRANADGSTELRCVFTMSEATEFLGLEQE